MRLVTSRTSALTSASPMRPSSSASSSSIGRGGGRRRLRRDRRRRPAGCGRNGDRRDWRPPGVAHAGGGHGRKQRRAERLERGQFGFRGHQVDGTNGVGEVHGVLVVLPGVGRAVAPVGVDQQGEERRRRVDPGPLAGDDAGPAQVGRRGAGQVGVQPAGERRDQGPQLVIGLGAVGVDERGRDVEGLHRHVGGQPVGPGHRHRAGQMVEGRADLGDELLDRLIEGASGYGRGSRHMGHTRGPPPGRSTALVTSKPWRE